MIVNLTPHPIHIYGWDVPDRIEPDGEHKPQLTIPASGEVARLGEIQLGGQMLPGCPLPVEYVEYRHATGLPRPELSEDRPATWYVVSLALALGRPDRPDLLVPYREVRNMEGTVIGCRTLARPV